MLSTPHGTAVHPEASTLRFVKDQHSKHTGITAILVAKNVKPVETEIGSYTLMDKSYAAGFTVNCEGFEIEPQVHVKITCKMEPHQLEATIARMMKRSDTYNSRLLPHMLVGTTEDRILARLRRAIKFTKQKQESCTIESSSKSTE